MTILRPELDEQQPSFDLIEEREQLWQTLHAQLLNANRNTECNESIAQLYVLERYWATPGIAALERIDGHIKQSCFQMAAHLVENCLKAIHAPKVRAFSPFTSSLDALDKPVIEQQSNQAHKPVFDFLIVHPQPLQYAFMYEQALSSLQSERDEHLYDLIFVDNLADALTALVSNTNIQAMMCISHCKVTSDVERANRIYSYISNVFQTHELGFEDTALTMQVLAQAIRPEVKNYYLSEVALAELPPLYFEQFERVFFHLHPFKDIHHHTLNGLRERFNTPFFHALQSYSQKPKGVFHALPISRANSIKDSVWISYFYDFYGDNIFAAETSSTQGGMDSLLNPKGAIKHSQDKAAACFGAKTTYFVTNGTSTSNKIVSQANITPGDIFLVSSDCHKSIPYAAMLSGAHVLFLQTNAVDKLDLYGGVSLEQIKQHLLELRDANLLHKVKSIVLTNSTFDGLIYDVEQYMYEILAIKPDIIFHWDEAWFSHAHFHYLYIKRHAMNAAKRLRERLNSTAYQVFFDEQPDKSQHPDPSKVVLRVYATQSTHKSLSSFRQGSMIHIFDEAFDESIFLEAFYTHTSTSPNYQILASLDIARRQVDLEGFARTHRAIYLAHLVRKQVREHPVISQVFTALETHDIVPEQMPIKSHTFASDKHKLVNEYQQPGFIVDNTRITLKISKTGMDGSNFRKLLIDKYDIQVNKTSRHTVLFIINIGTNKSTTDYLIKVLAEIAERVMLEKHKHIEETNKSTAGASPSVPITLPQSRTYCSVFKPYAQVQASVPDIIDIRLAYYASLQTGNIEYIKLNEAIIAQVKSGKQWVAAAFITPYPPGFPLLVPGQIITYELMIYFSSLNIKEIHGYMPELGIKVFKHDALNHLRDTQHANNNE